LSFNPSVDKSIKMKGKEKETAVMACVIGVCAMVSRGFRFARSLLCKLSELWGHHHGRGEERGPQGGGGEE